MLSPWRSTLSCDIDVVDVTGISGHFGSVSAVVALCELAYFEVLDDDVLTAMSTSEL
jgi:hypothetical protein